ncbi:MAG: uncharacterized protein JWN25_2953 [Verrucomicrobiales bacterium]|nr:uncharacterized protein [Verrucomicrobiales bacterium]
MSDGVDPGNQSKAIAQELKVLKEALLSLHKVLIDSERVEYEKSFGKVDSANRFLELLIRDPWFAWLHPLSLLAVSIDQFLDADEPPVAEDLQLMQKSTRELLQVIEGGHGFGSNYFEAMQRDPDVIFAHAAVMKTLGVGKTGATGK